MRKVRTYVYAAWLMAAIVLGAIWAQQSNTTTITVSAGGAGTAAGLADITSVGDVVLFTYYADEDDDSFDGAYIAEDAVGTIVPDSTTLDQDDGDNMVKTTTEVTNILYKIRTADTGRYMITILLTNVDKLVKAYSYLNLEITAYESDSTFNDLGNEEDSEWITLSNGRVVLYVEGSNYYVIKITDGVFYCIDTDPTDGSLSPSFYIMVDQA